MYLTGGHYKVEPVVKQAAILAREGNYLPLSILAEDFYSHQHEESYLEAASLVAYIVHTWGWTAFNQFYRDIHQQSGQNAAQAIDGALQRHFGISLQELDLRLVSWLMVQPVLPDMRSDFKCHGRLLQCNSRIPKSNGSFGLFPAGVAAGSG